MGPRRTSDGDLLLCCPVDVDVEAGRYTLVSSEATVIPPCGWRVYVTTPPGPFSHNLFFPAVMLSPSSSGSMVLSFNIYNSNSKTFHVTRGAPLALLTPVLFTRLMATITKNVPPGR